MADRAVGSFLGQRNSTVTSPASGIYNLGATANAQGNWPDDNVASVMQPFQLASITASDTLNTWTTYTASGLSSLAGKTGHILFQQVSHTFYCDAQIDNIVVDGVTKWSDQAQNGDWEQTPGWDLKAGMGSNAADPHISNILNLRGKYYFWQKLTSSASWFPLGTRISTSGSGFWTADNEGTGSASTGSTVDGSGSSTGYYIYFEASGTQIQSSLLKSPQITWDSSPNFSFRYSRYGANFSQGNTQTEVWFVSPF